MLRNVAIASLLGGLAFAGCLDAGPFEDAGADAGRSVDAASPDLASLLAGVPCVVSDAGPGTTSPNLKKLGELPYEGGSRAELDIRGDLAVHSTFGGGGFDLVDLTDRLNPRILSSYASPGETSFDVKLHPDGTTVFNAISLSVEVVDIQNRDDPKKTSQWTMPQSTGNAHMIYVHEIDNTTWVFVASQQEDGVAVLRVEGQPGAYTLRYVGSASTPTIVPLFGAHDMWATYDEVTRTHILYVANGFLGWLAYDIRNPASPRLLGGMVNADTHQGYIHTIGAQWLNGRRLVATVSEVGVNAMRVFDATDLSRPVLLGSWQYTIPAALQHNLQIVNGTLAFSHYTEGVFLFDLRKVGTAPYGQMLQLRPSAHYAVQRSSWDVNIKDGLLYVGDDRALHVVGYGCWPKIDAALTSTG